MAQVGETSYMIVEEFDPSNSLLPPQISCRLPNGDPRLRQQRLWQTNGRYADACEEIPISYGMTFLYSIPGHYLY
jgi:hypothetical protein